MSKLFTSAKLKDLEINNRLVMAPMCMYSASEEGIAQPFHFTHYVTRAMGGVGLIILEATAVEKRGRISPHDLGLWDDAHVDKLKELVDQVHQYGSKVGVQLGHAGRKCGVKTETPIAPSAIEFSDRYKTPNEMTIEDIKTAIQAFKDATRRAKEAGFDTIEIHGAHGYLINQFLSPLSNTRTDDYGGSFENRVRFLEEVLTAVKEEWPSHLPILLRLSVEEYHENGNHIDDYVDIVNRIKQHIDLLNVSSGAIVNIHFNIFPGYQLKLSEIIKKETGVPTIAGGLVTDVKMIEEVLNNDRADFVYLGRELIRNPYFLCFAAKELKVENFTIIDQYSRGF